MPETKTKICKNEILKRRDTVICPSDIEQETLRELYNRLGKISEREPTYLLYRYGFTDDMEHTLIGSAIYFNLRESRAKKLEDQVMDNL